MKILLIEDEAAVISLIERGLKEIGFEVSVAMDGHTGLQMVRNHDFNMVILDIMLPGVMVFRCVRRCDLRVFPSLY